MKPPIFNPAWSAEVKRVYEHDMQEWWDKSRAPHIWNMYHAQQALYTRLLPASTGLKILDVGCAQATLALRLAEHGHLVTAVDIRQAFLDYAQSRYTHGKIEFICSNVFERDLTAEYDVIFANQIIEHLVYPVDFVRKLSDGLKPGGKLIMSTPNGRYIKNTLPSFTALGDPAQWEEQQFTADGDGHFFAYLPTELKHIMDDAGLINTQVMPFETPWISGHMKFRHLHRLLPARLLNILDQLSLRWPTLAWRSGFQLLAQGQKP